MAHIVQDSFTVGVDTDLNLHTPELDTFGYGNWSTSTQGTEPWCSTVSGGLQTDLNNKWWRDVGDPNVGASIYFASNREPGFSSDSRADIFVRGNGVPYDDPTATYYYLYYQPAIDTLSLRKMVNNVSTTLAEDAAFPIDNDIGHRYGIIAEDQDVYAYFDGTLVLQATDSEIDGTVTGGTFCGGVQRLNNSASKVHDDFEVQEVEIPPESTQYNDAKMDYYRSQGTTSDEINTAEQEFLVGRIEVTLKTADNSTMWDQLLRALGYTGNLTGMRKQFWQDVGVLP